ncbi:MAG: C39 family peptidase [Propionibacteriaceae bacterium]|jgi:uncharacterized protein YvpB|nr:C39 family peptidase [Propionibacteriaceae bacterium]
MAAGRSSHRRFGTVAALSGLLVFLAAPQTLEAGPPPAEIQKDPDRIAGSLADQPSDQPTPDDQPTATPTTTAPTTTAPTPTAPTADHQFDADGQWLATRLDVPFVAQRPEMPTGCEPASVAMLLSYAGPAVSKEEVAAEMPRSADPELGFQGDPYDQDGGIIYPPALLGLVAAHLGTAADLSGTGWEALAAQLEAGKPVVVWLQPEQSWSHTVVLTGFSADQVWINDPDEGQTDPWGVIPDQPGDGKDLPVDREAFLTLWAGSGYRALSY